MAVMTASMAANTAAEEAATMADEVDLMVTEADEDVAALATEAVEEALIETAWSDSRTEAANEVDINTSTIKAHTVINHSNHRPRISHPRSKHISTSTTSAPRQTMANTAINHCFQKVQGLPRRPRFPMKARQ